MKSGVSRDTRSGPGASPAGWMLRAVVAALFVTAVAVVLPAWFDDWRLVRGETAPDLLAPGGPGRAIRGETAGIYDEELADVQVEGNVTIPRTAIAKYVKTRPGRPVSRKEVQEDVRSLYGTRWFFSVEPIFERTADGGAVLKFRVLERPVVRTVEFRGATERKKKHLIAETGLKTGSPFDPSANLEAARRIESWYHGKGHVFARCELVTGGEKEDRDVVFEIEEGPEVKVTGAKFKGNSFVSDGVLKTKLQTKIALLWLIGGHYDPATIPNDVTVLKQYYHGLGFFDVTIEAKEDFNDSKSRVTIVYHIDEGVRYKVRNVELVGHHVYSREELARDMKLTPGRYFNERELAHDVEHIKGLYGELGRIFARVEAVPRFLEEPGTADLVYNIDEDRPYLIGPINVRIEGPNAHTRRQEMLNIALRYGVAPGELANPHNIERMKQGIRGSMLVERTPGKDVQIVLKPELPDDGIRTAAAFRGQNHSEPPGPRSRTWYVPPAGRDVERAATPPMHGAPLGTLGHPGDSPREPEAAADGRAHDGRRSVERYRAPYDDFLEAEDDGYALVEPVAPRLPARSSAFPVFRAQNYDRGQVDPGNPIYDVSPQGDPLAPGRREPPPSPFLQQPGIVYPDVIVHEAQTGRFMIGAGVNSDAGVVGSIVLEENNFDIFRPPLSVSDITNGMAWRGGGQRFRIEAMPGNEVSRYLVSWTDPYFLDTDFSFGLSGFYFNRFYPDWDETRGGGLIKVGKQFDHALSGTIGLRLESIDISRPRVPTPPILADAVGSSFLSTIRFALQHDTRDSAFLPGRGHFAEIGYEQAFGDFDYPRFDAEYRQYFTVHSRPDGQGRHILTAGGNLGWTGDDTPIFERFYAGGFQTFRGFAFRGVSPVDTGVRTGGEWLALGSVEYMVPVTADENLQVVAFTDFGTVENDVSFDNFRLSVGAGLRLTVPAMGPVPLAFDFGVPILKEPFDDDRLFSFFVGFTR
ncbi:MAG: BamA/TamA family outer membrane protein [Planctomycetaceae bacterium]